MTRYQIEQESIRIRNERRANLRSAFILGIGIVGLAFSYAIIMIHFLGQ
jgi:hypothetical protein